MVRILIGNFRAVLNYPFYVDVAVTLSLQKWVCKSEANCFVRIHQ